MSSGMIEQSKYDALKAENEDLRKRLRETALLLAAEYEVRFATDRDPWGGDRESVYNGAKAALARFEEGK